MGGTSGSGSAAVFGSDWLLSSSAAPSTSWRGMQPPLCNRRPLHSPPTHLLDGQHAVGVGHAQVVDQLLGRQPLPVARQAPAVQARLQAAHGLREGGGVGAAQ